MNNINPLYILQEESASHALLMRAGKAGVKQKFMKPELYALTKNIKKATDDGGKKFPKHFRIKYSPPKIPTLFKAMGQ